MNIRDSVKRTIVTWLDRMCDNCSDEDIDKLVDQLLLSLLTCTRCGYQWYPRTPNLPKVCPNPKCKSPYWNKLRRKAKSI